MNQLSTRSRQYRMAYRLAFAFAAAATLHAGTTGAMPWESPLRLIAASLTGPVAFSVSIIGIFATGATLLWGGEMNEFARRAALMGLVVAVIVFATNIMSAAFGITGAVI